jgi:ribosomal protein S6
LKKYECLYIVNINFDSEGISTVVAKMEEILKNVGAEVKNTQHWGKR